MNKRYISEIIKRFVSQRHLPHTEEKIQRWILDNENSSEKEEEIQNFWHSLDLEPDQAVYNSLDIVNKRLNIETHHRKVTSAFLFKVAAVLIPILFFAGLAVYYSKSNTSSIVVTVAPGEHKQITLPDGSVVWVNAGSTLKYPEEFAKENRTIHLTGEAYFAVVRDTSRQFVVHAGKLDIQVLGTEFNVTAYPENNTITTSVARGKVQVLMPDHRDCLLTASQQVIYDKSSSKYIIETVPANNIPAWKEGKLIFEKKTISEILNTLERTYDVRFVTGDTLSVHRKKYTVKFVSHENIEEILTLLGDMIGFSHITEGKTIKISTPTSQ